MVEEWIEDIILSTNGIAGKDRKTASRITAIYRTWLTKQISFTNKIQETQKIFMI